MSTNCVIAYYSEDTEEVVSSYCHYDGYPSGVGATLNAYYNTPQTAESVALAGYLSALKPDLVESVLQSANHDRPVDYESIDEFLSVMSECPNIEFVYLWVEGDWKVLSLTHAVSPLKSVA